MPAPSKLAIGTSSVQRLLKDEQSYRKEQAQQETRIRQIESEKSNDENAGYILTQERKSLDETKAIFPNLRKRIAEAADKLEILLSEAEAAGVASVEEIAAGKQALNDAQTPR